MPARSSNGTQSVRRTVAPTLENGRLDRIAHELATASESGPLLAHFARVAHEDFGLSPFSAVGGLLRVAEEMEIIFEVSATRVSAS